MALFITAGAKLVVILLILFGAFMARKLYELFVRLPEKSDDRCWVAWGLLAEITLIVQGIIMIIK
jgi:hypothetical protein